MSTETMQLPKISRSLISIWTPDPEFSTSLILLKLYPKVQSIFSGDPIVLPNVDGIPPEVPRITLQSKNQTIRFEFSLQRINLVIQDRKDSDLDSIESIKNWSVKLLSLTLQILSIKIGRLAWVLDRYVENQNPGEALSHHFCKDSLVNVNTGALKRTENFELHAHKKYAILPDLLINSWVRCQTGTLKNGHEITKVMVVQQDLNTFAEDSETRKFTIDQVEAFLNAASIEFDSIYNLYFPK